MKDLRPAILLTLVFVFTTGLVFPALIWICGQLFFPFQANGSFQKDSSGKIIGSLLIGQNFSNIKYFHSRPSAAGAGYDAANSSGTNLGPISSKLINGIKDDPETASVDETFLGISDLARVYRIENNIPDSVRLPADAVTHSASGLDPDISPGNAELQIERIAKARSVSVEQVKQIIKENLEQRFFGVWGEPHLNVLKLNLALDCELTK